MSSSKIIVDSIVLARMSGSRLPGKVMLPALGKSILELMIDRLRCARSLGRIVVATSDHSSDDILADLCEARNIACFRGSLNDVVDRIYNCAKSYDMAHVAHFGADNPLIDSLICDEIVEVYKTNTTRFSYVTNNQPPSYPNGQEVEVTSFTALEAAWQATRSEPSTRHSDLFDFILEHGTEFHYKNCTHIVDLYHERWTLDYQEDYELVRAIFEDLQPRIGSCFGMAHILDHLGARPELRKLNARFNVKRPGVRQV